MWELLPIELIFIITLHLSIPEFFRFRCVCKSWLRASNTIVTPAGVPHFPWLLLPHRNDTTLVSCFSLPENRCYHLPAMIEAGNVVGCEDGWLAIVHENLKSCLINPLTRSQINLPPFSAFPSSHVGKIVFSLNPLVAVAVCGAYNDHLALARPGDAAWIPLHTLFDEFNCEDVAFHDGCLFAISRVGQFEVFDLTGVSPKRLLSSWSRILDDAYIGFPDIFFLVSSGNDLLKVRGVRCRNSGNVLSFAVMKLDWKVDSCWVETTNLGKQCLFLSRKHSLSFSGDDVKEQEENCIYFVSECEDGVDGVQVYDVEMQVIKPVFSRPFGFEGQPFSWFTPSLL